MRDTLIGRYMWLVAQLHHWQGLRVCRREGHVWHSVHLCPSGSVRPEAVRDVGDQCTRCASFRPKSRRPLDLTHWLR